MASQDYKKTIESGISPYSNTLNAFTSVLATFGTDIKALFGHIKTFLKSPGSHGKIDKTSGDNLNVMRSMDRSLKDLLRITSSAVTPQAIRFQGSGKAVPIAGAVMQRGGKIGTIPEATALSYGLGLGREHYKITRIVANSVKEYPPSEATGRGQPIRLGMDDTPLTRKMAQMAARSKEMPVERLAGRPMSSLQGRLLEAAKDLKQVQVASQVAWLDRMKMAMEIGVDPRGINAPRSPLAPPAMGGRTGGLVLDEYAKQVIHTSKKAYELSMPTVDPYYHPADSIGGMSPRMKSIFEAYQAAAQRPQPSALWLTEQPKRGIPGGSDLPGVALPAPVAPSGRLADESSVLGKLLSPSGLLGKGLGKVATFFGRGTSGIGDVAGAGGGGTAAAGEEAGAAGGAAAAAVPIAGAVIMISNGIETLKKHIAWAKAALVEGIKLPFTIASIGKSLLESQRVFSEASGSMAQVFAQWDTFNVFQSQRIGDKLAPSGAKLEQSLERFLTTLEPLIVGILSTLNNIASMILNTVSAVVEFMMFVGQKIGEELPWLRKLMQAIHDFLLQGAGGNNVDATQYMVNLGAEYDRRRVGMRPAHAD